MGVFPEDTKIVVSSLIRLWIAEGFLKPIAAKSLEVVAEEYLKDLIDRNLILVHKHGSNGKEKYCKIHDLLRDLCLREGKKDNFFWVRTVHDLDNLEGIQSQRRISIHKGAQKEYITNRVFEALPTASLARSLMCDFEGICLSSHSFRLVRVFNMASKYSSIRVKYYPKNIFKLVNSRYLDFWTKWKLNSRFPSIHLLWNLQTLIIKVEKRMRVFIGVPPEMWEMTQLRHLEIDGFSLPDPPNFALTHEGNDDFILRNLHTLKGANNFKLIEEVIKRIPNIKKLSLSYNVFRDKGWWHDYCFNNLGLLHKLESLCINGLFYTAPCFEMIQNLVFPHSLKKLTLLGTHLHWEDMRMIGSLPHLQVLKLKKQSFRGPEWNLVAGEFLCLKFLLIDRCEDLVYWNANSTHFPCLEKLVFRFLVNLEEIPLDIGHISTLQSIELLDCKESLVMSANNLLDEQVELGNEDLQVQVTCQENIELKSLASTNFG